MDGLSHFWVYGIAQVSRREVWVATFGGGVDVVDVVGNAELLQRLVGTAAAVRPKAHGGGAKTLVG